MENNDIILKNKLKTFLKKENCFEAFYNNFINFNADSFKNFIYDHTKETKLTIYIIANAFQWDKTQEGFVYWLRIHSKWGLYIRELIKKNDKEAYKSSLCIIPKYNNLCI